jgi:hypothetical protein
VVPIKVLYWVAILNGLAPHRPSLLIPTHEKIMGTIVMDIASVAFTVLQQDFITTLCEALGTPLREVQRVQPQLLAGFANQLRIKVMMRSGQRQLGNPALAMDRQMSMSSAAMMRLGVKMAPALQKPLPECVDLHEMSPISLKSFASQAVDEFMRAG